MSRDLPAVVQREVAELHQFFEDWFNGRLAQTEAAFARFADVMAADFVLVGPDASAAPRETLVNSLWGAYNARPGVHIWTQRARLRSQYDDLVIATYEEWQQPLDASARGRLSSVVFQLQDDAPNGLLWLHVHETWLSPPD